MAYLGVYNRFWADDWCYNRDFDNLGIIGTINTYFNTGEEALRGYSVNRYSLTLVSGLLYSLGIFGSKLTAILVIGTWFTGLYLTLNNLSKVNKALSKSTIILSSGVLLFFNLYISTQRFQVLYWTAGIHYSLTIITGIFLAVCITNQMTRESSSRLIEFIAAPLAFLAGGFSETGCAFLLSISGIWLAILWYQKRRKIDWAIKSFQTSVITFAFLMISLLVLASAPSNQIRTEVISSEPTSLLQTGILSFRFAFDFMLNSIRSLPSPHLIFAVAFISISILTSSGKESREISIQKSILVILIIAVILWVIIAAIQAPAVRFYSAPPDPRGKSLARFSMLVGLAVILWITGKIISSKLNNKLVTATAIFGLLLMSLYIVRATYSIYQERPVFARRAELWDERNDAIQDAIQQGQTRVEVSVIDMFGLGVTDIMKSKDMNGKWVSNCSSEYYGLDAIKAVQP